MTIETNATYRDGALFPDQPLNLPENTPVLVWVVASADDRGPTSEQVLAVRPKSPRITPEKFAAQLAKHTVSVGTLPTDFSREDIYSDHD